MIRNRLHHIYIPVVEMTECKNELSIRQGAGEYVCLSKAKTNAHIKEGDEGITLYLPGNALSRERKRVHVAGFARVPISEAFSWSLPRALSCVELEDSVGVSHVPQTAALEAYEFFSGVCGTTAANLTCK